MRSSSSSMNAMFLNDAGLNYSHDFVALTVKVQLAGEYTEKRSGRTHQVNKAG